MSRMTSPSDLTPAALAERGFTGFVPFGELGESEVPEEAGIYVIVRPSTEAPAFLAKSTAGPSKGRDPSVSAEVLADAWVDRASIMYVGKASAGENGRRGLHKRLDEYRRHGSGQAAQHWGGRYIWQLEDAAALLVAWLPTPGQDAGDAKASLIAEFVEAYGKRPFANLNSGAGGTKPEPSGLPDASE